MNYIYKLFIFWKLTFFLNHYPIPANKRVRSLPLNCLSSSLSFFYQLQKTQTSPFVKISLSRPALLLSRSTLLPFLLSAYCFLFCCFVVDRALSHRLQSWRAVRHTRRLSSATAYPHVFTREPPLAGSASWKTNNMSI